MVSGIELRRLKLDDGWMVYDCVMYYERPAVQ